MKKSLWSNQLSLGTAVVLVCMALARLSFGAEVAITAPQNGTTVSGTVTISVTLASNVWWDELQIDGNSIQTGTITNFSWNSTGVGNGSHTITVAAFAKGGTTPIGTASITVTVNNSATAATPAPTPRSTHYSTLQPGASLPSEAACVAAVNASPIPENAPWNQNDGTGYNSNVPPTGGVPSYFYANAPCCTELPHSDFAKVDGNYSGSTDDLIRITACKWGIDEDYIRSQAWIESGWHQDCAAAHGGSGCNEGGDMNSPSGNPSGLPVTSITPGGVFSAFDGFGGVSGRGHWDSWSIVQNKVYYEWMTWPMMEESTPFGLDYRYAEMRGCMNGDQYSYFNSQSSSSGTDYQNAVDAAKSNPSGGSKISGWNNLQYLAYGCIDTHYSGHWYNGQEDSYLSHFLSALSSAPWPGGLK
ncbi:MAG: Ig-like domain-containing protein [Candidatus Binataceae bacterium]